MRRSLHIVLAVVAMLALSTVTVSVRAASVDPCSSSNVLCAGQRLAWNRPGEFWRLYTADRRFTLYIDPNTFSIDEDEHTSRLNVGTTTWRIPYAARGASRGHPHATLTMQRNGNLVYRLGNGHVHWRSHTAGTGRHNQLILREDGNLVIRTESGKTVWSTHTTPNVMVRGQRLGSGQTWVNRSLSYAGLPAARLTMTRGGDLVLSHGAHRTWHSDTHVPGSVLKMRQNGRLVIVTPHYRVLWHSPAYGKSSFLQLQVDGRISLSAQFQKCWQRPANTSRDCGMG